jgi:hypothetical protein
MGPLLAEEATFAFPELVLPLLVGTVATPRRRPGRPPWFRAPQ